MPPPIVPPPCPPVPPILDVDTFRILRPGLVDPQRYPNALIQHYLTLGRAQLNWERWQDLYFEGLCDWTAHYVVIQVRNAQAAERGAVSGNSIGRITNKSVGGVSVTYDLGDSTEKDGGQWNTTTYGTAFLRNAQNVGAGGQQLGGCFYGPPNNGPAWSGPPQWEFLPEGGIGGF